MIKCAHSRLMKIDELLMIQNPKNNNKHPTDQIERLAKIIEFQGQRSPIVISNRSGFIIKGHARLQAIYKLGWKEAAVDFQDYKTEAEEYADMTADNEVARWAELDMSKFKQDLEDLDLGDIELLGLKDIPFLNDEIGKETKNTGAEIDLIFNYKIEINCENEQNQKMLTEEMEKRGYEVRVLI